MLLCCLLGQSLRPLGEPPWQLGHSALRGLPSLTSHCALNSQSGVCVRAWAALPLGARSLLCLLQGERPRTGGLRVPEIWPPGKWLLLWYSTSRRERMWTISSQENENRILIKPEFVLSRTLNLRKASITTRKIFWKDENFKRSLERVVNFVVWTD